MVFVWDKVLLKDILVSLMEKYLDLKFRNYEIRFFNVQYYIENIF